MSYFSRLTDIVECNLSAMLEESDNPAQLLADIIGEMESGIAGAQRSMKTAKNAEEGLRSQLAEHEERVTYWTQEAMKAVEAGNDNDARLALVRKREHEDLQNSLEQNLSAATETVDHLAKTFRGLAARYSDAKRKAKELGFTVTIDSQINEVVNEVLAGDEINDELAKLKQQMNQGA